MLGRIHRIRLVSVQPAVKDSEGRWTPAEITGADPPAVREYWGFVGAPRVGEVPQGLDVDAAAQLPPGVEPQPGEELVALDGWPGRYSIVSWSRGPAITRLLLKRGEAT